MRAGHRAELTADCAMVTLVSSGLANGNGELRIMKRGSGYTAAVRVFPDEVSDWNTCASHRCRITEMATNDRTRSKSSGESYYKCISLGLEAKNCKMHGVYTVLFKYSTHM